ncbi:hypothetical protein AB1N83_010920 [Pleurotus pulmonarius]
MGLFLYSFAAAAFCIATVLFNRRKYAFVRRLRGPLTSSWLLGTEHLLLRQAQVGDLEYAWIREYGATFHISSCYGSSEQAGVAYTRHRFHVFVLSPPRIRARYPANIQDAMSRDNQFRAHARATMGCEGDGAWRETQLNDIERQHAILHEKLNVNGKPLPDSESAPQ